VALPLARHSGGGRLAGSQAPIACALLHPETRTAAASPAAATGLEEVWDQRVEAKASRRGAVAAQRVL